jgi:transposase
MAGKTIEMSKLRKVIRLHTQGKSKSFISSYLRLSRNTVKKYLKRFCELKLTIEEIDAMDDLKLDELFVKSSIDRLPPHIESLYSFFPYAEKKLKKVGVTKRLLWQEYKQRFPDGVQSTQFSVHFNKWLKHNSHKPLMRMTHKAGDKMYVDYAGKTLEIVDRQTGEVTELQFFVAILGASQLTYAEASESQQKEDFIRSVENALHFYGGVPAAIVPDNLKSAVTKSNRYEPTINSTFLDFAEHYGTTILPARSYKPRDKSLAEGAVKILYTRIYTVLQDQTYFSIEHINKDIHKALASHNRKNFSNRSYSRKALFEEIEAHKLSMLPVKRFEVKQQVVATVMLNGHVLLGIDKHYYSVPFNYIRKKVKILYSKSVVEIYHKHNRIAVHPRVLSRYNYSTNEQHLASTHKFISEWSPQKFIDWAESIGSNVKKLIIHILEKKQHPEQAYKSCMGVLSLVKKVGKLRLDKACERALGYEIYNYRMVQKILSKGLDSIDVEKDSKANTPTHDNIRGKDYYN